VDLSINGFGSFHNVIESGLSGCNRHISVGLKDNELYTFLQLKYVIPPSMDFQAYFNGYKDNGGFKVMKVFSLHYIYLGFITPLCGQDLCLPEIILKDQCKSLARLKGKIMAFYNALPQLIPCNSLRLNTANNSNTPIKI